MATAPKVVVVTPSASGWPGCSLPQLGTPNVSGLSRPRQAPGRLPALPGPGCRRAPRRPGLVVPARTMAARGNARPGAERSCRAVCLSRLIDRRLIGNLGQAHRSAAAKRWLSRDWPTVTPIQVGAPWARPERTRTPRCRSTAHTWSASRRTSANRKFPSLGADRMPSPASAARSRARSVTVARPRSRYQPRAKVLGRGAHVGHRRPSVQRHTRDDEQGNQQEDVHARGRPGGRGEPGPQAEGQEVDGEDRDEEDGLQGPPLPSRSCRRIVRQNRPPAWSRPRRGGPGAALPARRRAAGSPPGPGTPDHEFAPGFWGHG